MDEDKIMNSIVYWYDRYTKLWIVQAKDANNNEIESECCPDKSWRDSAIAEYSEKYNTDNVRKI